MSELLAPTSEGAGPAAPPVRLTPLLIICLGLALQVVARYEWGFLKANEWQLAHIGIGVAWVLVVLVAFHGLGILRRISTRTWVLLGVGVGCFAIFWYYGRVNGYRRFFGPMGTEGLEPLYGFFYFSAMALLLRLIIPYAFARYAFGLRPSDLGLGRSGSKGAHFRWIYLALFLFVLPVVIYVSTTAPFLAKYPMCKGIVSPEGGIPFASFFAFECAYLLIFVSGEAFWRGYLTFSGERDLGLYAVAIMLVPYVTGHFGKPLAETLGAIATGVVLGVLALRHRNVWLGVVLHYAVALSMDLLAVLNKGHVIYFGD